MATFRLRHFSSSDILRTLSVDRLLRFFDPYRNYLAGRGVLLPPLGSGQPPDYDSLTQVFITPDAAMPDDLIDALYYVDEMATPQGLDGILRLAAWRGLDLAATDTDCPADIAVATYLLDPLLVQRAHGELLLDRPRSFASFRTTQPPPQCPELPAADAVELLEAALASWFDDHHRGHVARVLIFDRPDGRWFLVRHGQPFKREPRIDGGEPSSVAFRPLKHDVVVYDPARGELRINAETPGEKRLYVREFGRLLFDRDDAFPCLDKYNLEPLRNDGPRSLTCHDVDGLELVTLREVHLDWNGPFGQVEVRKATDLFAALAAQGGAELPATPKLVQAAFEISFAGQRRPRRVRVCVPNVAQYTRDADSVLVEEWMQRRGFLDVEPPG